MADKKVYDVISIGDNLTLYMASIYIQTSNFNQLIINKSTKDDLNFQGCDKVPGVVDVKNEEDLLNRLREQTKNLKVPLINEEIISIGVDEATDMRSDKFEVVTNKGKYYTRCLVYNDEYQINGLFSTKSKTFHNQAIEHLGNGCKLSFEIRDYISKSVSDENQDRKNTKFIFDQRSK